MVAVIVVIERVIFIVNIVGIIVVIIFAFDQSIVRRTLEAYESIHADARVHRVPAGVSHGFLV